MVLNNQFLTKVLCNFQVSNHLSTSDDHGQRKKVSHSLSSVPEYQSCVDSTSENYGEPEYESNLSSVATEHVSTISNIVTSISPGQVTEPEINNFQPPVFAVPLSRAPKAQNSSCNRPIQRLVEEVNNFYSNDYLSEAEKDYIFCKLGVFILKKALEKSYGENMLTRGRKEQIFQFFLRNQLISPANTDILLNSQTFAYDSASINSFSVNGRNGPGSVVSNSSFYPYQPVPLRYNYSSTSSGAYENSLNLPRVPFPVNPMVNSGRMLNETRGSSFEPVSFKNPMVNSGRMLNQTRGGTSFEPVSLKKSNDNFSRHILPGIRTLSDNERPNFQTASTFNVSKSQTMLNTNDRMVNNKHKQIDENIRTNNKRLVLSPVSRPQKRSDTPRKRVQKISRPQVSNGSNANNSMTRSGRVSKPLSRYWEFSK